MDVVIDELAKIEKSAAAIMDEVEIRKEKLDIAQKERIAKFDEDIREKTAKEISSIKKELEDSRQEQVKRQRAQSDEKFHAIDSYYEDHLEKISDSIFEQIIRK
jgi:hypothetical protein